MTGNFTVAFSLIGLFGVIGGLLILAVRPARSNVTKSLLNGEFQNCALAESTE
jgi:hypothetical protein